MTFRAQVIIADPPWSFDDELSGMRDGTNRGAQSQYPVLDLNRIAGLEVSSCADPDGCVLALWCPSTMLADGLKVMNSWGFNFKSTFVWVKTKKNALEKANEDKDLNSVLAFGMGRLFRQTHEIALIGTRGSVYKCLKNKSQRSVCLEENMGHSIKPENLHRSFEKMFPEAIKLELFARRKVEGWTCLGNEVCEGQDIRESLRELCNKSDGV